LLRTPELARVLATKDEKRYQVTVSALTDGRIPVLPGDQAIALVSSSLLAAVEGRRLGQARLGKLFSNDTHAEAALYLDRSFTEGACIGARCEVLAERIELTVARSSPALRGVVWGSLAVGLVLGLLGARVLLPSADREVLFFTGLGIGLVIAVVAMGVAVRIDALAGGRSAAMAASLDVVVRAWLAEREREPVPAPASSAGVVGGTKQVDEGGAVKKAKKKKKAIA
jgi:hypothetical protein